MFKLIILFLSSLLGASLGQITQTGQCDPNIALASNFNLQQFTGLWYEIRRTQSPDQTTNCASFNFAVNAQNAIGVHHDGVNDNFEETSTGTATLEAGTARLTLNLPMFGGQRNFWVLHQVDDYSVTYACENVGATQRRIYLWVLGREATIANQITENNIANFISSTLGIAWTSLSIVDHSERACTRLPVIPPGQPVVLPGSCDANIPVQQNFDLGRYVGTWYLIKNYFAVNAVGNCVTARYSLGTTGIDVLNSQVVNQNLLTIAGVATVVSNDNSARLKVVLTTSGGDIREDELSVIETDYDNYAILYKCENIIAMNQKRVVSWVISKQRQLSPTSATAVNRVIASIVDLNDRYYNAVDQSPEACFYYPAPTGQPVVMPGQCDETIPAKANFDPTRYVGVWYDLQSYPALFQSGSCFTAEYTLNTDLTVHVRNTQVRNQLLETWLGSARLATSDGTAKLKVNFNVNGDNVESDYWVLDTDYDTFALVYSCRNIDAENRAVNAWKLSRTKTLTPEANTIINNIMSTIPVLDQRYFVASGHDEEACSYNAVTEIVLSGQCAADSAVPAVTNFNPTLFAGTWYEVSRFPSSGQQGECVSTQYTLSGTNAFAVTQTSVNNERQVTTNAQATIAANGRGVLTATISGVPFTNVYILATDNTEYALAYACRNLDAQRKQVYSWKLSRNSTGLSLAAANAINQVANSHPDLVQGYYKTTGQDSNACFYYPNFPPDAPYIDLPGLCPTNIRGVANFNAGEYLGRWFETARFPTGNQIGQCNRAQYTAGPRVLVTNTEVNEQTLFTQTGFADASPDGSGLLNVEFTVNGQQRTADYYILTTDYTSYALVYNCVNLANGDHRVRSWKLSRTPELSAQAAAAMVPYIASTRGLLEEYYRNTLQTAAACFYIPALNTTEAPVFRGQCGTITGMQGFEPQRYMGWWHEIERYPVDAAQGECRSSQYTSVGTTYQVVDTQVTNNQGTVASGTVTVTNDGRLRRTIPGRPVQDIWVLATDYDSYALLYSCENVNAEYMRVWSAKHSKTRTLTQAAQTAMAPYIANRDELIEQFYLKVDQTDQTCFHYPTITQGPIVIPGQCDAGIPVVTNFNVSSFVGTWNHVARYDDLGGSSCVGTRLTQGEAIEVLHYEVRNNTLETVTGTGRVTSTDGNARLEITLPAASGSGTTTTPLSILATDYTSFAVAYSCNNVNAFQRQVRVWSLSRTRTMSPLGTAAINTLIAARQELHQPYFKTIVQNDDCPEPSSAMIVKSSIIVLLVCAVLQRLL